MLGVSQPANQPSSLRHSASFSCLQRGGGGGGGGVVGGPVEGHRARTSTLPQQPNNPQQNIISQYSAASSPSYKNDEHLHEGNDYGFARTRPRLRSTTGVLYEEETASFRETFQKSKEYPKNLVSNNPLRGALNLLTTSTSSWWKFRPRDDIVQSSTPPDGRKWSSSTTSTPGTVSQDRKWSLNSSASSAATSFIASPSNERKWTSCTGSSASSGSSQDRKWRSLGALLRTPVTNGAPNPFGKVQNGDSLPNSASKVTKVGRASNSNQQSSYSARTSRNSRELYRESCEFTVPQATAERSKVSRRLYQEKSVQDLNEEEAKPQVLAIALDQGNGSRSNRAQSFYLLDDFLRPQPGPTSLSHSYTSSSSSYVQTSRNGNGTGNFELTKHSSSSSSSNAGQNSVLVGNGINVTPPRRHNSSSDSLEVATSPLPPPVPPPPPQIIAKDWRDGRGTDNLREKELCPCRMCRTARHQKTSSTFADEVSFYFFYFLFTRQSLLG